MSRAVILTGPHCLVYVNGSLLGQISGFHWDNPTPKKQIRGLDSPSVVELAPTTNEVRFTMDLYRVKRSGGARGAGIKATFHDMARERYWGVNIIDRESGMSIFRADQCSTTNEHWDIESKNFLRGNVSVEALDFSDEIQPLQS